MQKSTFTVAKRSAGEWLSSLPTVVILLLTILLGMGFTALQVIEYSHAGFTYVGTLYGSAFFMVRSGARVKTCRPGIAPGCATAVVAGPCPRCAPMTPENARPPRPRRDHRRADGSC